MEEDASSAARVHRQFNFDERQFSYLQHVTVRGQMLPGDWDASNRSVTLTKAQYDAWFDDLTDILVGSGFTSTWDPTSEGILIESIIDILTDHL